MNIYQSPSQTIDPCVSAGGQKHWTGGHPRQGPAAGGPAEAPEQERLAGRHPRLRVDAAWTADVADGGLDRQHEGYESVAPEFANGPLQQHGVRPRPGGDRQEIDGQWQEEAQQDPVEELHSSEATWR